MELVLDEIRYTDSSKIQSALWDWSELPIDLEVVSVRLLWGYQKIWRPRRWLSFFRASAVDRPLRTLLIAKAELEDVSAGSLLYGTALEIINEFMSVHEYWDRLKRFKKQQRYLLSRNHERFFELLVLRDGKQCSECKSKRKKLCIDHIKPVSKGGLTELVNLRLLCYGCNSDKSGKFVEV